MPVVDLAAIPQVQLPFMNDDHAEEARLLNGLADALAALRGGTGAREDVLARLEALDRHTREHFEREDEVMRRTGFPAYPMHHGEHGRVLEELAEEGRVFAESGDAERLWSYVTRAVPAWFVRHIETMDQVTARFVAGSRP